jgi:hypothetical protein
MFFVVIRSDTGKLLSGGTVRCAASVGSTTLRLQSKSGPAKGIVKCAWLLPETAKGKILRGRAVVTFEGKTTTERFTRTVH